MFKKLPGVLFFFLISCSALVAAAKFPFPQQAKYAHGIMPAEVSPAHIQSIYDVFVRNFYEESGNLARIKFDTPNQTVSEGIGYGMLIMVYMDNESNNTQAKFDKLWNYFKQYPSSGSLMHWKINGFGGVAESGSATDGDIDVALALILAAKQWEDEKYLTGAKAIMSAIRQNDVSSNLLDGGDQWNSLNPSYMSMVATQLFQDVDAGGGWGTIQSSCYSHLKSNQNGSTGMWPNWTSGGVGGCPGCYGFDAARTPWRLGWAYLWYGHADAKSCCTKIVDWFKNKTGDEPGKIGQNYNLDGSINASGSADNIPTFLGPLVVAGMVDTNFQSWVDKGYTRLSTFGASNDNYYNESLELLTMLLLSGNMPDFAIAVPKTTAAITIKVTPAGAGTVTVDPQKTSYLRGDKVTISAASADPAKYTFVSWGGDYEGSEESTTITLSYDMTITASFKDKFAQDLVDDCEDGNARTNLKTPWFTFTDVNSNGKSTILPATTSASAFKMTEGGFESDYAVKIEYKLDKGGFSGDPFVGVGFQMKTNGDPFDISESEGISFYYKGSFGDTSCAIKVESDAITEAGASYRNFLKASTSWKEVVLYWKDFTQPKWAKNPATLDLKQVTKIQWQIQAASGSGELWLDDIHLIGMTIVGTSSPQPIVPTYAPEAFSCIQTRDNYSLQFINNQAGIVRIALYTLDGRFVTDVVNQVMSTGNHRVLLRPAVIGLSKGGYVACYRGAGDSRARRILIDR